jgi:uncharacterized membrane protein
MQCPVCHNEVAPQATFCNHCGASLAAAAPVAPAPGFAPVQPAQPSGYAEVPQAYTPPPAGGYAPPAGYQQAPPGYPPQPGYPQQAQASAGSGGLSETAAAALAYIFAIPAIIFLLVEPYNKTPLVRFHSFQAIGLVVVWFVVWVAMVILSMVLIFIPIVHLILFPLHLLIGLGFFIAWLVCIIKASKGEWFKLPVIGDFAMKQAQK